MISINDASVFICKRCGYNATTKGNLKRHLTTQKICKPKVSNVSRDEQFEQFITIRKGATIKCEWCDKTLRKSNQARHRVICVANPHKKDQINMKENKQEQSIQQQLDYANIFQELQNARNEIDLLKQEIKDLKIKNSILENKKNECFYQSLLEKYFNASHKVLDIGVTDITTHDTHIEIKRWNTWKEALSQLLLYNDYEPKDYLKVCFFDECSKQQKDKVCKSFKKYNIIIYEFIETNGTIFLQEFETGTKYLVYSTLNTIDYDVQ
jgi:polyhydroxyalkanoate synthesis regulator phasin